MVLKRQRVEIEIMCETLDNESSRLLSINLQQDEKEDDQEVT